MGKGLALMGSLYLVRHAQASFGAENYDLLSELGRKQCEILGQALLQRGIRPALLASGTLSRQFETAKTVAKYIRPNTDIFQSSAWNEFDHKRILDAYARAHPEPHSAIESRFALNFHQAMQRWISGEFAGDYGESWHDFTSRCHTSLRKLIGSLDENDDALVVTSGGPIAVIMGELLQLSHRAILRLNWSIANGSVTRIVFKNDALYCSFFNDYSHFEIIEPKILTYR